MPNVERIIARADRMRADRSVLDSHLQEIRDIMYPAAEGFTSKRTPGAKSRENVYDNTAEQAGEMLAAGLHALLTSPVLKWFSLSAQGRARQTFLAKRWLEEYRDLCLQVINSPAARFAPSQHQKYQSGSFFGTACQFIAERRGALPLFQTRDLRECYIAQNDEDTVDTVFRDYELTASQAVKAFPTGLGEKVLKAAGDPKKMENRFRFIHATMPRADAERTLSGVKAMPWASFYVCVDDKTALRDSGFPEVPWVVPRWYTFGTFPYGRGPGMRALPDTKMLQESMRTTIRAAEKAIEPPLQVADEGIYGDIDMSAGALNFVRPDLLVHGRADPIRPIESGSNPGIGEDFNASIRQRIEAAFHNDLLQQFRDPRMTATQVLKITEETRLLLGPMISRWQIEDLAPTIKRVTGIVGRAGLMPPPPAELSNATLEVQYESPVAKNQQLGAVKALGQLADLMTPLGPVFPDAWDNIKGDDAFREAAEILGVPLRWFRELQQVGNMREARREVTEAQAQGDGLMDAADAGSKVLGAMGKAGMVPGGAANAA